MANELVNTIAFADASIANLLQWKSFLEYQKNDQRLTEVSHLLRQVQVIKERAEKDLRKIEATDVLTKKTQ